MSFSLYARHRGQSDVAQEPHHSEDAARVALDAKLQTYVEKGCRVENKKIGHQRLTDVSDQQGLVVSYWISADD
jgi:hypothetical protein